jgi:hypothetical protein
MSVRKQSFRIGLLSLMAAGSIVSSPGTASAELRCFTPLHHTPAYNDEDPFCGFLPFLCGVDHYASPPVGYLVLKDTGTYAQGINLLLQHGWMLKSDLKEGWCNPRLRGLERNQRVLLQKQAK